MWNNHEDDNASSQRSVALNGPLFDRAVARGGWPNLWHEEVLRVPCPRLHRGQGFAALLSVRFICLTVRDWFSFGPVEADAAWYPDHSTRWAEWSNRHGLFLRNPQRR